MYKYLFLDLGENFSTPRPIASPLVPDNRFHALSDTCLSDLVTFHLLRYQLINRPLFQVGSLETSPRQFETTADLESIDGEATKTGRYLSMLHTSYTRTRIPTTLRIGHLSSLHLKNCLFSSPLSTSYQSLLLADSERARVFLARRLLVN